MAIQLRRGNEADLDISQLKPGEAAVCLDSGKIIVKLSGGNYLTLTDTDAIQEIVAGKAAASHTHAQSDITGLETALAGKADATATQTALAGKAAASHTHPAMTGADSNTAGTAGLVPAPAAGDNEKFLRGDGTWVRSLTTIDQVYPVGSIYMSVNSTSPSTLFGGTWERLKDTFLLAAGDAYSAGATGGEAAHLLTNDELPADMGSFSALNWNQTQLWNDTSGIVSTTIRTQDRTLPTGNTTGSSTYNFNGGNQAHNNMPPYLTVYMWKRTA